jgi:ubiquinone/menaquinone biosynthesis C-methylase UbiE
VQKTFRDYYEKEAEHVHRYDSSLFWDARYHNRRKQTIVSILKSHGRVGLFLDVGCGSGEYLFEMSDFCDESIGLDVSLAYLKRIKSFKKQFSLLQADAQALPFRDECVDCILCSETIEHLRSPDIALKEVSRVARQRFLISTPNYGLLRMAVNRISRSSVRSLDENVGHLKILSLHQLHEKLSASGCRIMLEKTLHVTPPILGEKLHLPKRLSRIITLFEFFLDRLLPRLGNVSIVDCQVYHGRQ